MLPLPLLCLQGLPGTSLSHITVCVVPTHPAHPKHNLWAQCSPILTISYEQVQLAVRSWVPQGPGLVISPMASEQVILCLHLAWVSQATSVKPHHTLHQT